MNWYCFRTAVKKEKIAARHVQETLGLEVFCPMVSQMKKTRVSKKRFTDAMFPCYAFARLNIEEHYRELRFVRGVAGLLQYGQHAPPLPDAFISELRQELNAGDTLYVKDETSSVGDRVVIDSGVFRDFVGEIVHASNGGDRVKVLLAFLGGRVTVTVDRTQISAANF